jgi:hypothetical protein
MADCARTAGVTTGKQGAPMTAAHNTAMILVRTATERTDPVGCRPRGLVEDESTRGFGTMDR